MVSLDCISGFVRTDGVRSTDAAEMGADSEKSFGNIAVIRTILHNSLGRQAGTRLMMEAGRFSAEEIARKNGFGNRQRIRRSFVRAFGQSPQAIQRTVRALVR